MKIRNFLLSVALLFSAIAHPQAAEVITYKQELENLKENPSYKHYFDTDVNQISHQLERKMQLFKAVPSKWQRSTLFMFTGLDVIVVTPELMPNLYAFIADVAQRAGIPTPTIFITLNEGVLNAAASKILNGMGGIIIFQKIINELSDAQLQAILAHEVGHIKHNHINKMVGLNLATLGLSAYGMYKLISYIKNGQSLTIQDYNACLYGSQIITFLTNALAIGKRFEKQADQFAFEMGHAQGMKETMNILDGKIQKIDAELLATSDKITAAKSELTPADFAELQQEFWIANGMYRLRRWIHENTPFESHPSNADRIAAAQAYLDAQVQVPAIEKA
jgi:Zn-dependent protease with chaperone function